MRKRERTFQWKREKVLQNRLHAHGKAEKLHAPLLYITSAAIVHKMYEHYTTFLKKASRKWKNAASVTKANWNLWPNEDYYGEQASFCTRSRELLRELQEKLCSWRELNINFSRARFHLTNALLEVAGSVSNFGCYYTQVETTSLLQQFKSFKTPLVGMSPSSQWLTFKPADVTRAGSQFLTQTLPEHCSTILFVLFHF